MRFVSVCRAMRRLISVCAFIAASGRAIFEESEQSIPTGTSIWPGKGDGRSLSLLSPWVSSCNRGIDLVIALDSSGSIGLTNYKNAFLGGAVEGLLYALGGATPTDALAEEASNVGLVVFSDTANLEIPLSRLDSGTVDGLASQASSVPYYGGFTATWDAISLASNTLQAAHDPTLPLNRPRMALVITDGQSQSRSCLYPCSTARTTLAAKNARAQAGISVGVLTVGDPALFNPQEIASIAGSDTDPLAANLIFSAPTPLSLTDPAFAYALLTNITSQLCPEPVKISLVGEGLPSSTVEASLLPGESMFIQVANVSYDYSLLEPGSIEAVDFEVIATATDSTAGLGNGVALQTCLSFDSKEPALDDAINSCGIPDLLGNETTAVDPSLLTQVMAGSYWPTPRRLLQTGATQRDLFVVVAAPPDLPPTAQGTPARIGFRLKARGCNMKKWSGQYQSDGTTPVILWESKKGSKKACKRCPKGLLMHSIDPNHPHFAICSPACPFKNQWYSKKAKVRPVCLSCATTCGSCTDSSDPRLCSSCSMAISGTTARYFLFNSHDTTLTLSQQSSYPSGSGQCLSACPAGFTTAYNVTSQQDWCVPPTPSSTPTPSKSGSRLPSVTPSVSTSFTATPTVPCNYIPGKIGSKTSNVKQFAVGATSTVFFTGMSSLTAKALNVQSDVAAGDEAICVAEAYCWPRYFYPSTHMGCLVEKGTDLVINSYKGRKLITVYPDPQYDFSSPTLIKGGGGFTDLYVMGEAITLAGGKAEFNVLLNPCKYMFLVPGRGVVTIGAGNLALCVSCPPSLVMLEPAGTASVNASVCAERCTYPNEFAYPQGDRQCTPCYATAPNACRSCSSPISPIVMDVLQRHCNSCPAGSGVLLLNSMDPTLPAANVSLYPADTGQCVTSCPAPYVSSTTVRADGTAVCVTPSPTPTSTRSSTSTSSATTTSTSSRTQSRTATPSFPSLSSTATATQSSSRTPLPGVVSPFTIKSQSIAPNPLSSSTSYLAMTVLNGGLRSSLDCSLEVLVCYRNDDLTNAAPSAWVRLYGLGNPFGYPTFDVGVVRNGWCLALNLGQTYVSGTTRKYLGLYFGPGMSSSSSLQPSGATIAVPWMYECSSSQLPSPIFLTASGSFPAFAGVQLKLPVSSSASITDGTAGNAVGTTIMYRVKAYSSVTGSLVDVTPLAGLAYFEGDSIPLYSCGLNIIQAWTTATSWSSSAPPPADSDVIEGAFTIDLGVTLVNPYLSFPFGFDLNDLARCVTITDTPHPTAAIDTETGLVGQLKVFGGIRALDCRVQVRLRFSDTASRFPALNGGYSIINTQRFKLARLDANEDAVDVIISVANGKDTLIDLGVLSNGAKLQLYWERYDAASGTYSFVSSSGEGYLEVPDRCVMAAEAPIFTAYLLSTGGGPEQPLAVSLPPASSNPAPFYVGISIDQVPLAVQISSTTTSAGSGSNAYLYLTVDGSDPRDSPTAVFVHSDPPADAFTTPVGPSYTFYLSAGGCVLVRAYVTRGDLADSVVAEAILCVDDNPSQLNPPVSNSWCPAAVMSTTNPATGNVGGIVCYPSDCSNFYYSCDATTTSYIYPDGSVEPSGVLTPVPDGYLCYSGALLPNNPYDWPPTCTNNRCDPRGIVRTAMAVNGVVSVGYGDAYLCGNGADGWDVTPTSNSTSSSSSSSSASEAFVLVSVENGICSVAQPWTYLLKLPSAALQTSDGGEAFNPYGALYLDTTNATAVPSSSYTFSALLSGALIPVFGGYLRTPTGSIQIRVRLNSPLLSAYSMGLFRLAQVDLVSAPFAATFQLLNGHEVLLDLGNVPPTPLALGKQGNVTLRLYVFPPDKAEWVQVVPTLPSSLLALEPVTAGFASPSATPSALSTATRTATSSTTPSGTISSSGTVTSTRTRTASSTRTVTSSATSSSSQSGSATLTVTPSGTSSWTASLTAGATPSNTATVSGSLSNTITATRSRSYSATLSRSYSSSMTSSATQSETGSSSSSETASSTDSETSSLTSSITSSETASGTSSETSSVTRTSSRTISPSQSISSTMTQTSSNTGTGSTSQTASSSPTITASVTDSGTSSLTASLSAFASHSTTPSVSLSGSLSISWSATVSQSFSRTQSATTTASVTQSASSSFSGTGSYSASETESATTSRSGSETRTRSPSRTANSFASTSPSLSISPSNSYTASNTASSTVSASLQPECKNCELGTAVYPNGHYCAWTAEERVARNVNRSLGLPVSYCSEHVHQCLNGKTYGLEQVPLGTLCQDDRLVNTFEADCWNPVRPSYTPWPSPASSVDGGLHCYHSPDKHICASSPQEAAYRRDRIAKGLPVSECYDSFYRCVGGVAFTLQPAPAGTLCWPGVDMEVVGADGLLPSPSATISPGYWYYDRGPFLHNWDERCALPVYTEGDYDDTYCPCVGPMCCAAGDGTSTTTASDMTTPSYPFCSRKYYLCSGSTSTRRGKKASIEPMDVAAGILCFANSTSDAGLMVFDGDLKCRADYTGGSNDGGGSTDGSGNASGTTGVDGFPNPSLCPVEGDPTSLYSHYIRCIDTTVAPYLPVDTQLCATTFYDCMGTTPYSFTNPKLVPDGTMCFNGSLVHSSDPICSGVVGSDAAAGGASLAAIPAGFVVTTSPAYLITAASIVVRGGLLDYTGITMTEEELFDAETALRKAIAEVLAGSTGLTVSIGDVDIIPYIGDGATSTAMGNGRAARRRLQQSRQPMWANHADEKGLVPLGSRRFARQLLSSSSSSSSFPFGASYQPPTEPLSNVSIASFSGSRKIPSSTKSTVPLFSPALLSYLASYALSPYPGLGPSVAAMTSTDQTIELVAPAVSARINISVTVTKKGTASSLKDTATAVQSKLAELLANSPAVLTAAIKKHYSTSDGSNTPISIASDEANATVTMAETLKRTVTRVASTSKSADDNSVSLGTILGSAAAVIITVGFIAAAVYLFIGGSNKKKQRRRERQEGGQSGIAAAAAGPGGEQVIDEGTGVRPGVRPFIPIWRSVPSGYVIEPSPLTTARDATAAMTPAEALFASSVASRAGMSAAISSNSSTGTITTSAIGALATDDPLVSPAGTASAVIRTPTAGAAARKPRASEANDPKAMTKSAKNSKKKRNKHKPTTKTGSAPEDAPSPAVVASGSTSTLSSAPSLHLESARTHTLSVSSSGELAAGSTGSAAVVAVSATAALAHHHPAFVPPLSPHLSSIAISTMTTTTVNKVPPFVPKLQAPKLASKSKEDQAKEAVAAAPWNPFTGATPRDETGTRLAFSGGAVESGSDNNGSFSARPLLLSSSPSDVPLAASSALSPNVSPPGLGIGASGTRSERHQVSFPPIATGPPLSSASPPRPPRSGATKKTSPALAATRHQLEAEGLSPSRPSPAAGSVLPSGGSLAGGGFDLDSPPLQSARSVASDTGLLASVGAAAASSAAATSMNLTSPPSLRADSSSSLSASTNAAGRLALDRTNNSNSKKWR
jgi:von Willebrand factor type A domain